MNRVIPIAVLCALAGASCAPKSEPSTAAEQRVRPSGEMGDCSAVCEFAPNEGDSAGIIGELLGAAKTAPLPAGATVLKGTLFAATWLQWRLEQRGVYAEVAEWICFACGSPLDDTTTAAIVQAVNGQTGKAAKLGVLYDEIRREMLALEAADGDPNNKSYVCRNWSAAIYDVASDAGLEPDWECSNVHVWVEFTDENGRIIVMDVLNEAMFSYAP